MSSGAEAVSTSISQEAQRQPVTVINLDQDIALSPEREADSQVPLRLMEVYLPEELININGQPHKVVLNEKGLTDAVNMVAEVGPGEYPKQVLFELGSGLQPKIFSMHKNPKPLLQKHAETGTAVNITLPREQFDSSMPTEQIAELIARGADRDLLTAVAQNIKARNSADKSWLRGVLVGGMMTGEGIGIGAVERGFVPKLEYGAIGAIAGGLVTAAAILGTINAKNNFGHDKKWARAIKSSRQKVDSFQSNSQLSNFYSRERIVYLQPAEVEAELQT